jgi:Secretion system C-terminal sorting domain
MKINFFRFAISVLILLFANNAFAQNIVEGEYWFDGNFSAKLPLGTYNVSNLNTGNLNIPTPGLNSGLHNITIRCKDNTGAWSAPINQIFLKKSYAKLTTYEYWFDNDYNTVSTPQPIPNQTDFTILDNLNVSSLSGDLHSVTYRVQDGDGVWSSPVTSHFLKKNPNKLVKLQYWFDNDFVNAKDYKVQTTPSSEIIVLPPLNEISTNFNDADVHIISFRCLAEDGKWSGVTNGMFVKGGNTKIVGYEYWFDDDYVKNKKVITSHLQYVTVPKINDLEKVPLGRHKLNVRFENEFGIWSSVISDSFTRAPILSIENLEPKLIINKSVLVPGQSITISGKDFYPNGKTILAITKPDGNEELILNTQVDVYGNFSITKLFDGKYLDGNYSIVAKDNTSNKFSTKVSFKVKNPIEQNLVITSPNTSNQNFILGKKIIITWKDYLEKNLTNGNSAFTSKSYKIEISNNNGFSWTVIQNLFIANKCKPAQINDFEYNNYIVATAGSYIIKITDNNNLSNTNISTMFNIIVSPISNFASSLEWDKSSNYLQANPIGLCADGTSRILLKITNLNPNTVTVSNIQATISSPANYSGTALLGKIMLASNIIAYNMEANSANSTSFLSNINGNNSDFYIWLVAPNDFTQNPQSEESIRSINVDVILTTNNGTESIQFANISIIRPPLMFVHGINSDEGAFESSKYELNGTTYYFAPKKEEKIIDYSSSYGAGSALNITNLEDFKKESNLWLFSGGPKKLHMFNYASYLQNAETLLDKRNGESNYEPHSFYEVLKSTQDLGYASCRADYVCHSMGGCMARTVINKYGDDYKSKTPGSRIKNYEQGYINKLITINTPHNGSPLADLIIENFNNTLPSDPRQILSEGLNLTFLNGMFVRNNLNTLEASPAINDLQMYGDGVRFKQTQNIKNHLIGGLVTLESLDNFESDFIKIYDYLIPDDGENGTIEDKTNRYYLNKFADAYVATNWDLVVPASSQFPSYNLASVPNIESNVLASTSKSTAWNSNHLNITNKLNVGNKIFQLLNSAIDGPSFADNIAANPRPGAKQYKKSRSILDSTFYFIDTIKVKFNNIQNSIIDIDSSLILSFTIKDTAQLKGVKIIFQGQVYPIVSKFPNQTLSIKVNTASLGKSKAIILSSYDSLGFKNLHYDTLNIIVASALPITNIFLKQHSYSLNKQEIKSIEIFGELNNQVIPMNYSRDTISVSIADTNVITFSKVTNSFTSKDTGTTFIVFNYHGFKDTAYIYLFKPISNAAPLALSNIVLSGIASNCINKLKWQLANNSQLSSIELQKSENAIYFTSIKTITKNFETNNVIDDAIVNENMNSYRLKVLDLSGNVAYSNTISLKGNCNAEGQWSISPNPASDFINITHQIKGKHVKTCTILDASGRVLKRIEIAYNVGFDYNFNVQLEGLAKGVYFCKLEYKNGISSSRDFIIK